MFDQVPLGDRCAHAHRPTEKKGQSPRGCEPGPRTSATVRGVHMIEANPDTVTTAYAPCAATALRSLRKQGAARQALRRLASALCAASA